LTELIGNGVKKHQYLDVGGRVQRNSDTDLLAIASQKRKLEYA
jgi:hypothetical protein